MFSLLQKAMSIFIMLLLILNLCSSFSYASAPDIDINLPIAELEGLIQQLEDALTGVVTQAAIQLRESIRELSEQMRQRIEQLKDAAKEVIAEAIFQLKQLLNELIKQAKALLREIDSMVRNAITCINQALAERIAQIKDSILSILEQVGDTVKDAVDHIYMRAGQLVDRGTNRVAVVLNTTLKIIAKIIIIVLEFILLFWLIRTLYKGIFPKHKVLRFGIPSLVVLLVIAGGYLLFSPTALAKILGSEVSLPKWETACQEGNRLYDRFIDLKNQNADSFILQAVGDSALTQLNWCVYASMSPEIARGTQNKIDEIGAILYPPPPPPPDDPLNVTPCSPGTRVSFDPRWLGIYDMRKVLNLEKLKKNNVLRATVIPMVRDTTAYFKNVRLITGKSKVVIDKPKLPFERVTPR